MFSLDEDDEGEVSFGESSDAERKMTPNIPKAPSVKTFDDSGNFEGASDLDSNTLRAFVVAVIYANIAVLFVFLGPMVWYFEGWSRLGPGVLVIGVLAAIRTYQTYRSWERSRDERKRAERAGDNSGSAADGRHTSSDGSERSADDSERSADDAETDRNDGDGTTGTDSEDDTPTDGVADDDTKPSEAS